MATSPSDRLVVRAGTPPPSTAPPVTKPPTTPPSLTIPLGKYNAKTGVGTVEGAVRRAAAEYGVTVTNQQVEEITDEVLQAEGVGGPGADRKTRWQAARRLRDAFRVVVLKSYFASGEAVPARAAY